MNRRNPALVIGKPHLADSSWGRLRIVLLLSDGYVINGQHY